jgi:hypothetical protein
MLGRMKRVPALATVAVIVASASLSRAQSRLDGAPAADAKDPEGQAAAEVVAPRSDDERPGASLSVDAGLERVVYDDYVPPIDVLAINLGFRYVSRWGASVHADVPITVLFHAADDGETHASFALGGVGLGADHTVGRRRLRLGLRGGIVLPIAQLATAPGLAMSPIQELADAARLPGSWLRAVVSPTVRWDSLSLGIELGADVPLPHLKYQDLFEHDSRVTSQTIGPLLHGALTGGIKTTRADFTIALRGDAYHFGWTVDGECDRLGCDTVLRTTLVVGVRWARVRAHPGLVLVLGRTFESEHGFDATLIGLTATATMGP